MVRLIRSSGLEIGDNRVDSIDHLLERGISHEISGLTTDTRPQHPILRRRVLDRILRLEVQFVPGTVVLGEPDPDVRVTRIERCRSVVVDLGRNLRRAELLDEGLRRGSLDSDDNLNLDDNEHNHHEYDVDVHQYDVHHHDFDYNQHDVHQHDVHEHQYDVAHLRYDVHQHDGSDDGGPCSRWGNLWRPRSDVRCSDDNIVDDVHDIIDHELDVHHHGSTDDRQPDNEPAEPRLGSSYCIVTSLGNDRTFHDTDDRTGNRAGNDICSDLSSSVVLRLHHTFFVSDVTAGQRIE